MPKYTFECKQCNKIEQSFTPSSVYEKSCSCGATMERRLPVIGGPAKVTEKMDDMTNVSHLVDQKEILHERKEDFYWSHEVPRMVNSGVYSTETMIEKGWVFINEKGLIQIHTKPPEKR